MMNNNYFKYIFLIILISGCQDLDERSLQQPQENLPDQEGWDSVVRVTNAGDPTAVIRYQHMRQFTDQKKTYFDGGIEVDFYNTDGGHASNLVAERGIMFDTRRNFEAHGDVVLVSDSGSVLHTEELKWDNSTQKIFSNVFFTLTTTKGDTITGDQFESDPKLENVFIRQPRAVTATSVELRELDEDVVEAEPDSAQESSAISDSTKKEVLEE